MKVKATCPTCSTRLTALHDKKLWRTCNACNRTNPRQYPYCGWCASPMENTEMRAKLSEVATPPGGWPSLASELVEVRFFIEQGNFADAFELLAILKQRHPLHPELEEFTQNPNNIRADTGVQQVVDGVLANSASLSETQVPRRAAVRWDAPQAKGTAHATGSHLPISPVEFDDEPPKKPKKKKKQTKRAGKATRRGHQAVGSMPVVPIIPDEVRLKSPARRRANEKAKEKVDDKPADKASEAPNLETKSRLRTKRYEPLKTPLVTSPVPGAPIESVPAPEPLRTPLPKPAADIEARPMATPIRKTVAQSQPLPVANEEGETNLHRVQKHNTLPIDASEIEELAPRSGVLYSEPDTEEEEERVAAERRTATRRGLAEAAARAKVEAAAQAAAERARRLAQEARQHAEEQEAREAEEAAEAARLALEEAVAELPDRPGAQTGSTHVGPAPETPAQTGDTAVQAVPEAPPRTGDTEVGEPPQMPAGATGDTAVGPPPAGAAPQPAAANPAGVGDGDHPAPAPADGVVERSAPQVKVDTVVGKPPSADPNFVPPKGLTMAVDALQPPAPFEEKGKAARKKGRGRGRGKRAMKPRKRSGKLTPVNAEQQQERAEKARRRAARFGSTIVGK